MDKTDPGYFVHCTKCALLTYLLLKTRKNVKTEAQNKFLQNVCFYWKNTCSFVHTRKKLQKRKKFMAWTKRGGRGGYQNPRIQFCPRRTKFALNHPVIDLQIAIQTAWLLNCLLHLNAFVGGATTCDSPISNGADRKSKSEKLRQPSFGRYN